jgi:hypothetical protein
MAPAPTVAKRSSKQNGRMEDLLEYLKACSGL